LHHEDQLCTTFLDCNAKLPSCGWRSMGPPSSNQREAGKLGSNKRVRQYTPDRGYFHTAISYAVVRNLDPPLGQCLYFESSAPS
ncbi:hypothetical protein GW17_00034760, partial [Ensete ventricosum]